MPAVIEGRPDLQDKNFGITRLKRYPPYVFGRPGQAKLVHKVAYVELRWYEYHTRDSLLRLDIPRAAAHANCGMMFFLSPRPYQASKKKMKPRPVATLCQLPEVDAVVCGRCNGEAPTFGRNSRKNITPQEAMRRLACFQTMEGENIS